jgi:heterotetrameric sarcosine oxidase delta subunit
MSFLLTCPACGPRDVYEFRYGGEVQRRPQPGSSPDEWADYLYTRTNVAGHERAAWFHRDGCRRWFEAERDTRDNHVISTTWPEPAAPPPGSDRGPGEGAS